MARFPDFSERVEEILLRPKRKTVKKIKRKRDEFGNIVEEEVELEIEHGPQVLHLQMREGTAEHVEFDGKESWNAAMRDPEVETKWTHLVGRCETIADMIMRAEGGAS